MATRFWFSTTDATITPDYDAVWDYTNMSNRKKMYTSKQETGSIYRNDFETDALPVYCCLRQLISNEQFNVHNFTTEETWKLQIQGRESDAAADAYVSIIAKVISNDGTVVRGTIINSINDGLEIDDASYENRSMSGSISNAVSMQDGDRILVEIGLYFANTTTSSMGAELIFQDNKASDLPEDDTTSGGLQNPWFELSASLSESAGEFVYAGDVPLGLIPDDPKGILSMVYGGNIPMSALPSYSSILDRVYSGDIPLMVLPDFPKAILEKSYDGNIGLVIIPNSLYEFLGLEFVYSGDIPVSILPGYSSILDRIYSGDIGLGVIPTSGYELEALIEVVKTVFLKSKLTERLVEQKSTIKPSIVLNSEIKPEGGE